MAQDVLGKNSHLSVNWPGPDGGEHKKSAAG